MNLANGRKTRNVLISSSLFVAMLFPPVAAFADHNDFHTIQQLQSQLASLQQAFLTLFAAATPAQPAKGTSTAATPAVPEKKAASGTPSFPVSTPPTAQSAQPATPAQPYFGTGQPAISAQQATPIEQIPQQPQSETKEVIRSLQTQVNEARGQVVQQLQSNIQSLQTQVIELQSKQQVISGGQGTPPPMPEVAFTRTLQRGSSGDDVQKLQEFLAQDKDIYPQGLATGYFGSATEAAVKRFQKKHGIDQVGIVGPKTREKLQELAAGNCAQSVTRPCYDKQTGMKIIQLQPMGGEQAFAACLKNSAQNNQGSVTIKTSLGDEVVQHCYEGQSNVFLRKFEGNNVITEPPLVGSDDKPESGDKIQLITPNGGEQFLTKHSNTITWSGGRKTVQLILVDASASATSNLKNVMSLSQGYVTTYQFTPEEKVSGGKAFDSAEQAGVVFDALLGSIVWDVTGACYPNGIGGYWCQYIPSWNTYGAQGFKILVLADDEKWDISDAPFSILRHIAYDSLTMQCPVGGEQIKTGTPAHVTWMPNPYIQYVDTQAVTFFDVNLLKGGALVHSFLSNTLMHHGQTWLNVTMPSDILVGSDYTIEIVAHNPDGSLVRDSSDKPFKVIDTVPAENITLDLYSDEGPTIVRRKNGDLFMLWTSRRENTNNWSSVTFYMYNSISHDNGKTWSKPQITEFGSNEYIPHSSWGLGLTEDSNGNLVLFMTYINYNIGEMGVGSGLATWTSRDGITWDNRRMVTPTIGQDVNRLLAGSIIQAKDGYYYASYSFGTDAPTVNNPHHVYVVRSHDLATWDNPVDISSTFDFSYPTLMQGGDGTFRMAFISDRSGTVTVASSADGLHWDVPQALTQQQLYSRWRILNMIEIQGKPVIFTGPGPLQYTVFEAGQWSNTKGVNIGADYSLQLGFSIAALGDGSVAIGYVSSNEGCQRDIKFKNMGDLGLR